MTADKALLDTHRALRSLWLEHEDVFSYLSPEHQWQLHGYFKPDKNLTDEELTEHYQQVTQEDPELAMEACQALTELQHILRGGRPAFQPASVPMEKYGEVKGRLVVRAVVRPEIDYDKVALATLLHAQRIVREEEGKPFELEDDDLKRAMADMMFAKGELETEEKRGKGEATPGAEP